MNPEREEPLIDIGASSTTDLRYHIKILCYSYVQDVGVNDAPRENLKSLQPAAVDLNQFWQSLPPVFTIDEEVDTDPIRAHVKATDRLFEPCDLLCSCIDCIIRNLAFCQSTCQRDAHLRIILCHDS